MAWLLVLLGSAGPLHAACPANVETAAAVSSARISTILACCDGAQSRRAFLRCAKDLIGMRVHEGSLPRGCRRQSLGCARRSTCGRPGAVTCCVAHGDTTRCRVKRDAEHCPSPHDGAACVDPYIPSCCEEAGACANGCASCRYPECTGFCGFSRSYCQPFRTVDPAAGIEQVRCGCTPVNAPACAGSGDVCRVGACPPGQVCTTFVATGECHCAPP